MQVMGVVFDKSPFSHYKFLLEKVPASLAFHTVRNVLIFCVQVLNSVSHAC